MNTIQGRDITPVLDNAQDFTFEIFSESLFFATYSPEQPHRNYHNYRMTNQGIPKDEQPLCYLFS